ncbi:signal peptide peptidase SppA [Capnocytophaga catalasegens]|uniref:Signal peptide peptidase SppA n=1 Tax=Capnocytophaga catalasegens TaxID=1004260 RepID=A0AAV5ASR4_9FLAO|nr:signal peptide peptidase SppA [Capnocytophaga catalasegens]GIZ16440.1 signal peptide peptidase SppA [Capnocytophaga catalasegens]GJM50321.1 signal peptide peptidase SppA [Capnocytophaga catalasegens]GJM53838.1 signal peptide peptidase SppA [Capnocytophaga catalasegens]
MNFLKNILASIIGVMIAIGIFFFLLIVFISLAGSGMESKISVKDNSILVLNFEEKVNDFAQKVIIEDFDFDDQDYNGLNLIIKAIQYAKTDDKIKGISIKSAEGIQGYAQLKELRDAVADFKNSGKFIYSFNQQDMISQRDYYLQSVADSIFIGVTSQIMLQGLGANVNYYKDFQEKIGIKMEVFRHGKYKSAVEPYLDNKMSDANREQITERLLSIWNNYTETIQKSRNISKEKLNQIADSLGGRTPKLALQNKLIDGVRYRDQYEKLLCKSTKTDKVKDLNFISIEKYTEAVAQKLKNEKKKDQRIAVIYAEGTIVSGKSDSNVVGDETIIEALREAREEEKVKAIILRINSPGGSALASELIHREIELTKKEKPVYVSMSNLAASGGYYIACNANRIFADAETITGSIGVFMTIPNVAALSEKIGITNEQVGTNRYSTGIYRGYNIEEVTSPEVTKLITEGIEEFYNTFVQRVAEGRKMSPEAVNEIAQGRVWTGTDALKNGLIDEIGSLQDVLSYVAKEHNIKEYSTNVYPVFKLNFKELLKKKSPFSINTEEIISNEIGKEAYKTLKKIQQMGQIEGLQARLPYDIEIK